VLAIILVFIVRDYSLNSIRLNETNLLIVITNYVIDHTRKQHKLAVQYA